MQFIFQMWLNTGKYKKKLHFKFVIFLNSTRTNADPGPTSVSVAPPALLAVFPWSHICLSGPLHHSIRMSQHTVTWRQAVMGRVWRGDHKSYCNSQSILHFCESRYTGWYIRVGSATRSVWDGELDTLLLWLDDIWASSSEGEGEGLSHTRSCKTTQIDDWEPVKLLLPDFPTDILNSMSRSWPHVDTSDSFLGKKIKNIKGYLNLCH